MFDLICMKRISVIIKLIIYKVVMPSQFEKLLFVFGTKCIISFNFAITSTKLNMWSLYQMDLTTKAWNTYPKLAVDTKMILNRTNALRTNHSCGVQSHLKFSKI